MGILCILTKTLVEHGHKFQRGIPLKRKFSSGCLYIIRFADVWARSIATSDLTDPYIVNYVYSSAYRPGELRNIGILGAGMLGFT